MPTPSSPSTTRARPRSPAGSAASERLAKVPEAIKRYPKTFHLLGQSTYDIGDGEATGEVYCIAHHLTPDDHGGTDYVMFIRYEDTYRTDDDGVVEVRRAPAAGRLDRDARGQPAAPLGGADGRSTRRAACRGGGRRFGHRPRLDPRPGAGRRAGDDRGPHRAEARGRDGHARRRGPGRRVLRVRRPRRLLGAGRGRGRVRRRTPAADRRRGPGRRWDVTGAPVRRRHLQPRGRRERAPGVPLPQVRRPGDGPVGRRFVRRHLVDRGRVLHPVPRLVRRGEGRGRPIGARRGRRARRRSASASTRCNRG